MKKIVPYIIFTFVILFSGCTQKEFVKKKPTLIVGIVIDQMRYDYLTRFANRYGENGFKRLLDNGFSLENAHYNYTPTYTAPGHASIYTGTTPSNHGIISNTWYDKFEKKSVYCVDDFKYKTVGDNGDAGQKSPSRMFTTTITDQLHLAQNMRGKTIGIALKDRSAILPVGHTANAAYWFDGSWISSSFYQEKLPDWVIKFNKNGDIERHLNTPWETLYDIKTYTSSLSDNNAFEGLFTGEEKPIFPKNIPALKEKNGKNNLIKSIPAGNTFTVDFAKAAIIEENLGNSEDTDFLAISFSSTDYVGHKYGPDAIETEDTYLRLDKDLGILFSFLDTQIGKDNYVVFLTADHAAVQVPAYLQSLKIPAHYLNSSALKKFILQTSEKYFHSDEIIQNVSNFQIFLNKEVIESLGLEVYKVAQKLADEALSFEGIYKTVTARTLQSTHFSDGILNSLQNGYNQKLSGDVLMIPYPATLNGGRTGTSHGSGYSYDTHIPMIFYGNGIKKGSSSKKYEIIDIAPTIAQLLQIEAPNGTTGKVITEILE
jgi:predicted AlkP superfamily pyrophosphatase or phosphodiesterase